MQAFKKAQEQFSDSLKYHPDAFVFTSNSGWSFGRPDANDSQEDSKG
jgi:hypothetical protein